MKKIIIIIVAIAVCIGAFFYFQPKEEAVEVKTNTTIAITKGPIKQTIFANGTIESGDTINVYSEIASNLISINKNIGDTVNKGDIIAVLDTTALEQSLKSAEYQYKVDYDQLENLKTKGDASVTASYQKALNGYNDAKKTYDANLSLYESGIISKDALSNNQAALDNAYVSYVSAKDNLNTTDIGSEIERLDMKLAIDQMNIDSILEDIEAATITAPISGTIVQGVEDINKSLNKGELLFIIEDLNNLIIEATVSEYEINDIKLNQEVHIELLGDDAVYKGTISYIAPTATAGTDVTIPIEVEIIDEDTQLKPNFTANIEITVAAKEEAFIVPYEAVLDNAKGTFLMIIRDGEQMMLPVNKGISSDLYMEVISDEIQPTDEIIVSIASANMETERGLTLPGMGMKTNRSAPGKK